MSLTGRRSLTLSILNFSKSVISYWKETWSKNLGVVKFGYLIRNNLVSPRWINIYHKIQRDIKWKYHKNIAFFTLNNSNFVFSRWCCSEFICFTLIVQCQFVFEYLKRTPKQKDKRCRISLSMAISKGRYKSKRL